jgi:hypothetical protein
MQLPRLGRSIKHFFAIEIRLLTAEECLVERLSVEKSWNMFRAAEAARVRSLIPQ